MDYKEQAVLNKNLAAEWNKCSYIARIGGMKPEDFLLLNATAITDLLARAEAAENALSGKAGHTGAGETASKLLSYSKDMDIPEDVRAEIHAAAIMLFGVEEALRAAEVAEARAEKAERERDAAVSDLETIMAYNPDTCSFCKNVQCYVRGGAKPCLPKWRGQKEE